MLDEEVPVLIVGGGGAGLTASMLLARQGVGAPAGQRAPADLRPAQGPCPEPAGDGGARRRGRRRRDRAAQHAGRADGGDGVLRGLRRSRTRTTGAAWPAWSAGAPAGRTSSWRAASPWRQLNLPQIRLEPLLKARAEELSPGRIRFGHELIGLEQDDEGVRATIRDNASGRALRGALPVPARGGRRAARRRPDRRRVRGARRDHADRDAARVRRLLAVGEGSRRADPLDLLPADRRPGGDGPDGARAVGTRLGGVGDPPELPGRRSPGPVRRAGRSRRPPGAGHSGRCR